MRAYFNVEQEDPHLYHIVLNTEHIGYNAAALGISVSVADGKVTLAGMTSSGSVRGSRTILRECATSIIASSACPLAASRSDLNFKERLCWLSMPGIKSDPSPVPSDPAPTGKVGRFCMYGTRK
jgi:hypothetical protein